MNRTYNLLQEPWIPVRRVSGIIDMIAPWQIAEPEDPPVRIESPRPDFDGAITQFLIGLLQTGMTPNSVEEWEGLFESPPPISELQSRLQCFQEAFWLDGDGCRFFQDRDLPEAPKKANGVEALLIDAAGANTIKKNKDFFVTRERIPRMSLPIAAMALLTLQINAPAGGAGHRTSLRGGGPLTTLLLGRTLWETLWLNVLLQEDLAKVPGNRELDSLSAIFPWLDATRTSEKKTGQNTSAKDIHPYQHFWGMPRRIRLMFAGEGLCPLSGETATRTVVAYVTAPSGVNYTAEELRHPLTPHSRQKEGKPWLTRKGQPSGLSYRDWPALTLQHGDNRVPAACVSAAQAQRWMELLPEEHQRLWVFGYDMDNMKARCWYSGTTPFLSAPTAEHRQLLASLAGHCVDASEYARRELLTQTKAAMFRRPKDAKGDLSVLSHQFWAATEAGFSRMLDTIHKHLANNIDDILPTETLEAWLVELQEAAQAIFAVSSQCAADFSAADVKRIAIAHNTLRWKLSLRSKAFRKTLHLA